MRIKQWIRFFLKKCHPPPPCHFAWKLEGRFTNLTIPGFRAHLLGEIFVNSWKFRPFCASRQNLFFEFCGLAPIGILASVEIATLSCFNQDFSAIVWRGPLPFSYNDDTWKIFNNLYWVRIHRPALRHSLFSKSLCELSGGNPFVDGIFLGHNLLLSQAFSVGIPRWMGFF
jgi:hypothetical protein